MSTPSVTPMRPFAGLATTASPMQAMMRTVSAVAKVTQTAGIEWADFAKQSVDHGTATLRKLAKARDPKSVLVIQAEFLKGSYERIGAQTRTLGDLYSGLAGDLLRHPGGSAASQITKA